MIPINESVPESPHVKKERLDKVLMARGLAHSRERAKARIMTGNVLVNHQPVDKPGTMIPADALVEVRGEDLPFVSRGGVKLEAALKDFDVDVRDLECMDIGASTGGFTDCLLQHGARKVYAVDVGYGQLAWKLRNDSRVVAIERTNIRHLPDGVIPSPVDLVTIDVSFISLKIVVPAALKFLRSPADILALVKPQFEVGKGLVGKGGVVRDAELHEKVIQDLTRFFQALELTFLGVIPSPIQGPKGNREFVVHLRRETSPSAV
jgi:23S rRNA (cytidine1920-2'-O)/16S rRNA (cytidine1409-2'-O)-methyltransferase